MRPSTSPGVKVLSSMGRKPLERWPCPVGEARSSARQGAVRSFPPRTGRWIRPGSVAGARDAFYFGPYRAFEKRREVLVHPLADQRLQLVDDGVRMLAEPFAGNRLEAVAHRLLEQGRDGRAVGGGLRRLNGFGGRRSVIGLGRGLDAGEGVLQRLAGLVGEDALMRGH